MYNGGAKNVTYKLDLAPLDMLKSENFEHDIFKVTNPVGEIKPGQTALLEWHFNPLEAKTYMVRACAPMAAAQQSESESVPELGNNAHHLSWTPVAEIPQKFRICRSTYRYTFTTATRR